MPRLRPNRITPNASSNNIWLHLKNIDYFFLGLVLSLASFGLVMVYNASVVIADRQFNDKFYFARHQLIWFLISVVAMAIVFYLPTAWWKRNAKFLLGMTIVLLITVLLGSKTMGAKRWLTIYGLNMQPSEIAKITLIAYLASLFEQPINVAKEVLKTTAIVLALVLIQPDLDTTVVLAISSIAVYWIAGAPLKHFGMILMAGMSGLIGMIFVSSYRLNRLKTFLDASNDPLGVSYHARQVLLALGAGGWLGVGLAQSRQKYGYLPEVAGDSIFAIIAEETGFIGCSLIVTLFVILIFRGMHIARNAPDQYSRLLATGLVAWIGAQTFMNIASMAVLIPLTGITLPLISYGGTSLLITFVSVGVLLKISASSQLKNKTSPVYTVKK